MAVGMKAVEMIHAKDPKREILDEVKPYLDQVGVIRPYDVVVATYVRPATTASGLYLPDKTIKEDLYQGKVGLILKMGDLAFSEDETHRFPNGAPKVHDWVVYRVGDTFPFVLGNRHCRVVDEHNIRLRIEKPDIIL